MKKYIMPPLVLTIICIVISGLLVVAYNKTYVDTTGIITEKMQAGCEEIFGDADYVMLKDEESGLPITFEADGVMSIITNSEKTNCLIELYQDGYAKDGLHLLVGINQSGAIEGIYFLDITETKDIGTKVQDKSFLEKLIGATADTEIASIDNISNATYSSKGMKAACEKAVKLYSEQKEAILGE